MLALIMTKCWHPNAVGVRPSPSVFCLWIDEYDIYAKRLTHFSLDTETIDNTAYSKVIFWM